MPDFRHIDQAQILQWVDTGLLIALIVFLAGFLLAFLRGLLRGWKQGTYRLVALGIILTVLLFLTPVFADTAGGVDLRQWTGESATITMGKQSFVLKFGTVFETGYNFFYGLLHDIYQVKASPEAIANYAIALTGSILRLVIVFLAAFLTETIGALLIWLLWHIAFKHIIKREKRHPTLRPVSGLEEVVTWSVLAALTLIPFTGIFNAVHNNGNLPNDEGNETIAFVNKILETYDNSVFNKALFSWTKGSGKDTIDTQIAEFFAQNTYTANGTSYAANFITELRVFSSLEGSLINWMFNKTPSEGTVTAIIQTAINVGESLYSIGLTQNESLLNGIVPLTLDVAYSLEPIQEEIGVIEDATPANLKKAYRNVSQGDYVSTIESVFTGDYAVACYDSSAPFSEDVYERVKANIESDESAHEFVNQIITGYVLAGSEANPEWQREGGFNSILPKNGDAIDEAAIADIDWWREATIFHEFDRQFGQVMPKMADSSGDIAQEYLNDFLNALADRPMEFIEILVGPRDDKGEPSVDGTGRSNNGNLCLLDSDLVSLLMPYALEIGGYYIQNSVLTDAEDPDLQTQISDLSIKLTGEGAKDSRINFKREFGSILDILGKVAQTDYGKAYIRDYESHPGLDFAADGTLIDLDPKLAEALMLGIRSMDRSQLMTLAAPVMGDHFVRPALNEGFLADVGIKNINFHVDKLGDKLADFLSVAVDCNDLISYLGGLGNTESGSIDASTFINAIADLETETGKYQLTHFLDILTGSPIINPDVTESGVTYENRNIELLLNYVLSNIQFDDGKTLEIEKGFLDDVQLASGWDGETIDKTNLGEIFYVMSAFRCLVDPETGLVAQLTNLSTVSSSEAVSILSRIDVANIFASIGRSTIMRSLVPDLFDKYLIGTMLNADEAIDMKAIGVTYTSLISADDWADEGMAMQAIIDLAVRGLDLAQLDFFSPAVIQLFTKMSQSRMFYAAQYDATGALKTDSEDNVVYEYVFPTFVTDKLLLSLTTKDSIRLFIDYPDKVIELDHMVDRIDTLIDFYSDWDKKESLDRKKQICSIFVRSVAQLKTEEDWAGEFKLLGRALSAASGLGGLTGFDHLDSGNVSALSLAINNIAVSEAFGPVLTGNIFYRALTSSSIPEEISGGTNAKPNVGYFFRNAESFVNAKETGAPTTSIVADRLNEVNGLMNLINLTLGNDAIRDSSGNINLSFASLDVESFLRPVLLSTVNSKVFNPTSPSDMYRDDEPVPSTTVFHNLVLLFMSRSGVFIDHDGASCTDYDTPIKGSDKTMRALVHGVEDWEAEIENLCVVVSALQDSDFLNSDGQFDMKALEDLPAFFAKPGSSEELRYIIYCVESSELFYRCIPPKLDSALGDALDGMTIQNISDDIRCADFFYTRTSDGKDFEAYDIDEIATLVRVFESLSTCTNIDLTNMSTVNTDALVSALTDMGLSKIFNTNTQKSHDVFYPKGGVYQARDGLTSYQCLLCDLALIDSLKPYYRLNESPKDQANLSLYTQAEEKIAIEIPKMIPALGGAVTEEVFLAAADKYIAKEWADVLRLLKQSRYSGFIDGSMAFEDLTEECFSKLLVTLNACSFYRDCVPNAFYDALVNKATIGVTGIDFHAADVFFSYYFYDGDQFSPTPRSEPNFDMPFYEPEIDQIAMIYTLLKKHKDSMSNIHMDSIDELSFRNIMVELHDSYVFHEAAKDRRRSATFTPEKNFTDFTVFEQFIYKIFVDTTLYSAAYSPRKDYVYGVNYGADAAYYKLHDRIVNLTTSNNHLWVDEVSAITTDGRPHLGDDEDPVVGIVAAGKAAGIFNSSSEVGVDFDTLNRISPRQIKSLLYAINFSLLLEDVLPNSVGDLLCKNAQGKGIGLTRFTSMTRNYDGYVGKHLFRLIDHPEHFDDADTSKAFHPVDSIAFATSSNPTGHFSVRLVDGADVTSLVDLKYELGVARFTTSGFPKAFEIYLDPTVAIESAVEVTYDTNNFNVGRDVYATRSIRAIGKLLSSAYRGTNGGLRTEDMYFSFNDSSDMTLESFFADASDYRHSTYGILNMFGESGFYDYKFNDLGIFVTDGSGVYDSGARALYNALSFHVEADIHLEIDIIPGVTVTLPNSAEIAIGAYIGDCDNAEGHIEAIYDTMQTFTTFADYVREASWFDVYAGSAGTMDVYAKYQYMGLHEDEIDGVVITNPYNRRILCFGIDLGILTFEEAYLSMQKLLGSVGYSYSIEVPDDPEHVDLYEDPDTRPSFGVQIVAGLLDAVQDNKIGIVDLEASGLSPIAGISTKYSRIGDPAKHVEEEYDALADDFRANDFELINPAYLSEVSQILLASHYLYVEPYHADEAMVTDMARAFTEFGIQCRRFANLFYLASMYERMVSGGGLGIDIYPIFDIDSHTGAITDFPFVDRNGYLAGVETPFSFSAVAEAINRYRDARFHP